MKNKSLKKLKEEYFKESNKVKKWLEEIRKEWEEKFRKDPKLKEIYDKIERMEKEEKRKIKELEKKLSKEDREIREIMLEIRRVKIDLFSRRVPMNEKMELIFDSDKKMLDEANRYMKKLIKLLEDEYKLKGMKKMDKKAREVLIYDKDKFKETEKDESKRGRNDGGYDDYVLFISAYKGYLSGKKRLALYGMGYLYQGYKN